MNLSFIHLTTAARQQIFLLMSILTTIKGNSDPSHFIFEINVGKSRIRHRTTLKLNDELLNRVKFDFHSNSESFYRKFMIHNFYVGSDSFRHWFQNKMARVWSPGLKTLDYPYKILSFVEIMILADNNKDAKARFQIHFDFICCTRSMWQMLERTYVSH